MSGTDSIACFFTDFVIRNVLREYMVGLEQQPVRIEFFCNFTDALENSNILYYPLDYLGDFVVNIYNSHNSWMLFIRWDFARTLRNLQL